MRVILLGLRRCARLWSRVEVFRLGCKRRNGCPKPVGDCRSFCDGRGPRWGQLLGEWARRGCFEQELAIQTAGTANRTPGPSDGRGGGNAAGATSAR